MQVSDIEKNVALPKRKSYGKNVSDLIDLCSKLDILDSFVVSGVKRLTLYTRLSKVKKHLKISLKTKYNYEDKNIRVWRVE